jgi:hypothetical protein
MKFVNRYFSVITYLVFMLLTVLVDGLAGTHINLWIVYFIPIGLATWNLGRNTGLWFTVITLMLLLATAVIWGHPYSSWGHLALSYFSKVLAYLVLVFLVAALRKKEVERVFVPSNSHK